MSTLYDPEGPYRVSALLEGAIEEASIRLYFNHVVPVASLHPLVVSSASSGVQPAAVVDDADVCSSSEAKTQLAEGGQNAIYQLTFGGVQRLLDTRFGVLVPELDTLDEALAVAGLKKMFYTSCTSSGALQDFAFTLLMLAAVPWVIQLRSWGYPAPAWTSNVKVQYDKEREDTVVVYEESALVQGKGLDKLLRRERVLAREAGAVVPNISKLFTKKVMLIHRATHQETKTNHGDELMKIGRALSAAAGILLIDTHYQGTVRAMLSVRPNAGEHDDAWPYYGPPLKALLSLKSYSEVTSTTSKEQVLIHIHLCVCFAS